MRTVRGLNIGPKRPIEEDNPPRGRTIQVPRAGRDVQVLMQAAIKFDSLDVPSSEADDEVIEIDPIFEPEAANSRTVSRILSVVGELDSAHPFGDVEKNNSASPPRSLTLVDDGDEKLSPHKRVMWGRIEELSLVDLIQTLGANRTQGRVLARTEIGNGHLEIANGRIGDVAFEELQGGAALSRMLSAKEGDFEVISCPVNAGERALGEVSPVLFESLRRLDEANRCAKEVPPFSHVMMLVEGSDPRTLAGDEREQTLIVTVADYFAEPASVSRARKVDRLGDEEFYTAVAKLWRSGMLRDTGRKESFARQTGYLIDAPASARESEPLPFPVVPIVRRIAADPHVANEVAANDGAAHVSQPLMFAPRWPAWMMGLAIGFCLGGLVATWWWQFR
jgi:hypothetical protein